jgi:hypothetical protein
MTLNDLSGYARLLYGDRWQTQLAVALRLNERTVRQWVQRGAMPPSYTQSLRTALIDRMHEINSALDILERDLPLAHPE